MDTRKSEFYFIESIKTKKEKKSNAMTYSKTLFEKKTNFPLFM